MKPARWLRDPLAWVLVLSAGTTLAIAALVISTLGPGLDQMVARAPVDKPVEDLGERLAEAEPAATPPPPPPAVTPVPVTPRRPVVRQPEWAEEERPARPARQDVEPPRRGLRRQIRELEHLREALEREQRQIRRHAQQDSRWDPDGHHIRQMRLVQLDLEIARVERDIRRLEQGDGRYD